MNSVSKSIRTMVRIAALLCFSFSNLCGGFMKSLRAIVLSMACLLAFSHSMPLLAETDDETENVNVDAVGHPVESGSVDFDGKETFLANVNVKVTNLCPFNLWIHGGGNG